MDRTCYSRSIMLARPCEQEARGCLQACATHPDALGPDAGGARARIGSLLQHREWMGKREALAHSPALAPPADDGGCGSQPPGTGTRFSSNGEAMNEAI